MNITDYFDANVTDSATLSVRWKGEMIRKGDVEGCSVVTLPQYFKLQKSSENEKGEWIAVSPEEVPAKTGLHDVSFHRSEDDRESLTYVTPEDKDSSWKNPGPAAGPF